MDPLSAKLASLLGTQTAQNALNASGGGILAAVFGGRKHPFKLISSALVALLVGWNWGGFVAESFWVIFICENTLIESIENCAPTPSGYKAFSFGIGLISWPLVANVDKIFKMLVRKWLPQ